MGDENSLVGIRKAGGISHRSRRSSRFLGIAREDLTGYLFISPWLIGFLAFTLGPFLGSLYLSFSRWNLLTPIKWVGTANYLKIFTDDPTFLKSLSNTAIYVLFRVPGVQLIGLALALVLNQKLRGIAVYRTLFYLPSVTAGVSTALIWLWLFNTYFGLINVALDALFGVQGPNWLYSRQWAMPSLIIMGWWNVGQPMIIYLAGLQNIPGHLYEAAEIDGAGLWAKFRNVTIPMLTPFVFFNLINSGIGAFRVFTNAYIMTRGGPAEATLFYVLNLFYVAFDDLRMGYASALAWILFLIILFFTLAQVRLSNRWVYYEAMKPAGGA